MDEAEEVWDKVAASLETFLDAWEQDAAPPCPGEHAPNEPESVRRLALIELVKVDLEYRWQRQQDVLSLEDYATRFTELTEPHGMPADLIYEDFNLRQNSGLAVDPTEYFERFPDQSDQLKHLLGLASPDVTTSLAVSKRPAGFHAGDQVDDFDLLAELGSGAFACVFLARQKSLQRIVALKISRDHGLEPQTLAQLDHPHIGRVYDQRVLADRNVRLLYMKYVPGGTLEAAAKYSRTLPFEQRSGHTILASVDKALDQRGEEAPLESSARAALAELDWPMTVCRLGVQLAEALDYAHQRGVLHRDLKPANILLTNEGSPQLVDFNISFCSKLDGATPTAYFGGSLAYMSPEQLEASNPASDRSAESLDGRSDIYSLGVVLWELLTGERPFEDEPPTGNWSATLELMRQRRLPGPDSEKLDHHVPPAIRTALTRCLASDRYQRPASAKELAAELRLCMQPEAHRLLRPALDSYIVMLRPWSLILLLFLAMLPNILAGWFNFVYNRDQIVAKLQDSQEPFWNVQFAINAVAYPLGILLLSLAYYSVVKAVLSPQPLEEGRAERLRGRCLNLGLTSALISVVEWLVAGFAYPLAMNAAGVQLNPSDYFHFLISLTLCGIIAATYPFFGATAFAVHILYPALLGVDCDRTNELMRLRRLERKVWFFLALGFLLPMLAVVLVVTFGSNQFRTALTILSAGSLVGCSGLFWAARRIHRDANVLRGSLSSNTERAY